MTLWLLDASVLLAGEDPDDDQHRAARGLLAGDDPIATLDLAHYEVVNVAVRAWSDQPAAARLVARLAAIGGDGGIVQVDGQLIDAAGALAEEHGISVHDAAYVAAASRRGAELVSCDVRDLVSRHLARLPADVAPH